MPILSLVENIGNHENYKCGYCKSTDSNKSFGIWAHFLTIDDYQALLNKGWRRSGKYCYKPDILNMCCPHHTIRCNALEFNLLKSHKKVIKRMGQFLQGKDINECLKMEKADEKNAISNQAKVHKAPKPGIGADPNKPPCFKKKLQHKEKRELKSNIELKAKPLKEKKQLEDYLNEHLKNGDQKWILQIKLVPASLKSQEFKDSLRESFDIYKKYQCNVHHDKPSELKFDSFQRFLVDSPLVVPEGHIGSMQSSLSKLSDESTTKTSLNSSHSDIVPLINAYGTVHCQYWLEPLSDPCKATEAKKINFNESSTSAKLIAVGVLDILSECLSSKYFYYDPSYSHLSLGVYSALLEIAIVRKYNRLIDSQAFKYYYMGYYIHTCPKMRYKAQYEPSFLLCTAHMDWHPIAECTALFEKLSSQNAKNSSNIIDFCHPPMKETDINGSGFDPLQDPIIELHDKENKENLIDKTKLPSKITSYKPPSMDVQFQLIYYDHAVISYTEYISKLITRSKLKNKNFKKGLETIENDIKDFASIVGIESIILYQAD